MEDEREKEDETLFQKYFEEKEIEFMFPSGIHGLHSYLIFQISKCGSTKPGPSGPSVDSCFKPETASEMQHQRNINLAKVSI